MILELQSAITLSFIFSKYITSRPYFNVIEFHGIFISKEIPWSQMLVQLTTECKELIQISPGIGF